MIRENPQSVIADRAMAERHELIRRCAASVIAERDFGLWVDPHRLQWARAVIAATPALLQHLSDGSARPLNGRRLNDQDTTKGVVA